MKGAEVHSSARNTLRLGNQRLLLILAVKIYLVPEFEFNRKSWGLRGTCRVLCSIS